MGGGRGESVSSDTKADFWQTNLRGGEWEGCVTWMTSARHGVDGDVRVGIDTMLLLLIYVYGEVWGWWGPGG